VAELVSSRRNCKLDFTTLIIAKNSDKHATIFYGLVKFLSNFGALWWWSSYEIEQFRIGLVNIGLALISFHILAISFLVGFIINVRIGVSLAKWSMVIALKK
jgi:hypothetical protein